MYPGNKYRAQQAKQQQTQLPNQSQQVYPPQPTPQYGYQQQYPPQPQQPISQYGNQQQPIPQYGYPSMQPPQQPQQYSAQQPYYPTNQPPQQYGYPGQPAPEYGYQAQQQSQPQWDANMQNPQYKLSDESTRSHQDANGYQITEASKPSNVQIVEGVPRIVGGNKRALLIGINYTGSKAQLRGCHNDVANLQDLLVNVYKFPTDQQHMLILTDEDKSKDRWHQPLYESIEAAMKWLVQDASPGDSFVFQYSGHGGQARDKSGDESDGMDETILPLDFEQRGEIIDDRMHELMVKPLPEGCRLTAIFDSCHSGSALDLPFCYLPDGKVKHSKSAAVMFAKGLGSVGLSYLKGDKMGAVKGIFNLISSAAKGPGMSDAKREQVKKDQSSRADVYSFSGCKDSQTSADATIDSKATGAMSWALTTSLRKNPQQSIAGLLGTTRLLLQGKYSQIPQLGSGKMTDMNQLFAL